MRHLAIVLLAVCAVFGPALLGQTPTDQDAELRMLRAENKALRAQVERLRRDVAMLKEGLVGMPTTWPVANRPATVPVKATKPVTRIQPILDRIAIYRKACAPGLTRLQQSAITNAPNASRWKDQRVGLTAKILDVRPANYKERRTWSRIWWKDPRAATRLYPACVIARYETPGLHIDLTVIVPHDRAANLAKGTEVYFKGKLRELRVGDGSAEAVLDTTPPAKPVRKVRRRKRRRTLPVTGRPRIP